MDPKASKNGSSRPPSERKESSVRRMTRPDERRLAERWPSDAKVEILTPDPQEAIALDVSAFGLRVAVPGWLSTGLICDLRITTHSGRVISKRARVVWARRASNESCIAGLRIVSMRGSSLPPRP